LGYNYNLEPILRDASNQVYQVHDGAIKAITQVRDDGVPVEFSANLRAGTFTLKTQPQGAIRADVQGAIIKGAYRDTGADLVRHLVTREALTAEDLDSASFTAFKSLCPQPVGLYLKDSTNLADCLDQIITQTLGGYWYFDRLGKLKLWRLDNPTGTASHEFNPDDFPRNTLTIQRRDQPIEKIELGFFRNWAPQEAGSLSESVGALARSRQSTEYARSVKTQTASGFKDRYPLAAKPPLQGTLFSAYDGLGIRATAKADCDAEAIRRRDLFSVVRTTYSAKLTAGAFQLHLGDEIKIRHPRFGFADGQNAIVVGIEESPTGGAATVEFWR